MRTRELAVDLDTGQGQTASDDYRAVSVENEFVVILLAVDSDASHSLHGWCVESLKSDGIGRICPHVEECRPAEKLDYAYGPEHFRSLYKKPQHAFRLHILRFAVVDTVELRILMRRHFLYLGKGIYHAKGEDECTEIESPCNRRRHLAGRGCIAQKPSEYEWSDISYYRAGIAQE